MKKILSLSFTVFLYAGIAVFAGFFQSCSKSNEIQPIHLQPNTVTIKVKNMDMGLSEKHLRIVSVPASAGIVLDTTITGNFEYSFTAKNPNITVTASLSSATPFVCSLQIDGNHSMQAYHNGGCATNEFDITREMNF
jgi:hypothetical protein